MVGDYDIYSDNASNIRLQNFEFNLDISASSNLLRLVGLEGYLEDAAEDFEAQARANINNAGCVALGHARPPAPKSGTALAVPCLKPFGAGVRFYVPGPEDGRIAIRILVPVWLR